jgi:hypothetical protein
MPIAHGGWAGRASADQSSAAVARDHPHLSGPAA